MPLSFGLVALAMSLLSTAIYVPLARRLQLVDTPNHRSAHKRVTPSSGGIAIIFSVLMSLLLARLSGYALGGAPEHIALLMLLVICALGAWDDRRPVPVFWRLCAFFMLAAGTVASVVQDTSVPLWLYPALILGVAWLFNLYNFMDGIDGLAALQTVVVAGGMLSLGLVTGADRAFLMLCAVIMGAYAGFLAVNWPPAKLFMGDAGSLSAGLLLAWLGLWAWRDELMPVVVWFLLMSPFILDTGITLTGRALHRERLTEAHSGHCYQRLARHWGSHRRVDYALLLLQGLWLMPLSLIAILTPLPQWTLLVLGVFPQLLLIAKLRRLK